MSDAADDPLLGLLTDIAEGMAAQSARINAMEANIAIHHTQANEALATIAEIATRTYFVCKPESALPDEVINNAVMNAMVDRWPRDTVVSMPPHDRQVLSELELHSDETIDRLIARSKADQDASNAGRIRTRVRLDFLQREKERRAKARRMERGERGRSR